MTRKTFTSWRHGCALALTMLATLASAPTRGQMFGMGDFSMFSMAQPLEEIARGNVWKKLEAPDIAGYITGNMVANEGLNVAEQALGAAMSGLATGGASLAFSAMEMAQRAASMAAMAGMAASSQAQVDQSMAEADAMRRAQALMPDEDRPFEARAMIEMLKGEMGTVVPWTNPATGAKGVVMSVNQSDMGAIACLSVLRQYERGALKREVEGMLCRNEQGVWHQMEG